MRHSLSPDTCGLVIMWSDLSFFLPDTKKYLLLAGNQLKDPADFYIFYVAGPCVLDMNSVKLSRCSVDRKMHAPCLQELGLKMNVRTLVTLWCHNKPVRPKPRPPGLTILEGFQKIFSDWLYPVVSSKEKPEWGGRKTTTLLVLVVKNYKYPFLSMS